MSQPGKGSAAALDIPRCPGTESSRDYAKLPLDWIPKEIPEHAKIIVSALPELKEKLAHTITYPFGPMSVTEGEKLLETWLASVSRTVQPHQGQEVMEKFASNGTPLYLKLAFETARTWHSYAKYSGIGVDVDGVLDEYCVFRAIPATDSDRFRTPVPIHSGRAFRLIPDTHSGAFRTPLRGLNDAG